MAVAVTPGSGATVAADVIGTPHSPASGEQVQYVKIDVGAAGSSSPVNGSVPVSATSLPLPAGAATAAKQPALGTAGTASADVLSVQGVASMTPLKTDGSGVTQPVSGTLTANAGTNLNTSLLALESGGNLATLAGTVTSAKVQTNLAQVAGTTVDTNSGNKSAGTQRVVLATDQPSLTNALKVDGSAVTQPVSATSLPLPSGASTAAKQPALGTAGSAAADVLTVQGIASMTPLKTDGSGVTQPVSGTVTANAGTNLNTSLLALESGGNLATLAGAVTSAKVQTNLAQVGGVSTATGHGTASGALRVELPTDGTGQVVALGSVASGAADSGNPVKVGGKYVAAGITLTDGQRGDAQLDASGFLKVNVAAGSSGNGAASATGSAVPSQADYGGVNVSGTLRGRTGVNPSGSVYAAQGDLTSVAGTTTATGNGTSSAGCQRVTIASDNTAFAVSASQATASNFNAQVVGTVAAGSADSGNPVKVGGKYVAAGVTLTDGQRGDLQLDSSGSLKVNVVTGGGGGASTVAISQTTPGSTNAVSLVDVAATTGSIGAADSTGSSTGIGGQTLLPNTAAFNSTVVANFSGATSVIVELTGTWAGTVQFEAAVNTYWVPVAMTPLGTTTMITSTTTNGVCQGVVAGMTGFRVRATALSSGSCGVRILPAYGHGSANTVGLNGGSSIVGKLGIDQTTPGTTNAVYLSGGSASVGGYLTTPTANFTRPANTTAYASGNLVANSTTAGSVTPLSWTAARVAAGSGLIREARLKKSNATVTNATFRLHLYSASPTCTNGDGGAWLTTQSGYLGSIDVDLSAGYGRVFSDPAAEAIGLPSIGNEIPFSLGSGQTIYGLLQAQAPYTPASAEVFTVELEVLQN